MDSMEDRTLLEGEGGSYTAKGAPPASGDLGYAGVGCEAGLPPVERDIADNALCIGQPFN
ncbi:hypothetical protein [Azospirillum soli]|uniref:hypothetical protein n=1 Tax=Azospirillum soli TaxID=1304799 RepID=UPI001AE7F4AF|nr:hypothetical protein [Azospirillum soli]MBP2315757.1 hypothetical protein [Azospirillum soli]